MIRTVLMQLATAASLLILTYYFFVVGVYFAVMWLALVRLAARMRVVRAGVDLPGEALTPVSILVPAYNEGANIVQSVRSLLEQDYPEFEVVVVDDGSRDDTLAQLRAAFDLEPDTLPAAAPLTCKPLRAAYRDRCRNLRVLSKDNGGKADALNAGLNAARYPLVCCVDADGLLQPDALRRLACHFARSEKTVAVGGVVRPLNGCRVEQGRVRQALLPRTALEQVQVVEYLRAFFVGRFGWERLNGLLIVSGAFGMFDRAALLAIGGYAETVGEDVELTLRLHRKMRELHRPYAITMAPDAVCWTQVPMSVRDLRGQRVRWHRGLADTLARHRGALLNPRYGAVGMLALPFYWFVELLGPAVEVTGYGIFFFLLACGVVMPQALMLLAMAYLYGVVQSVAAIAAEDRTTRLYRVPGSTLRLVLICLWEPLLYRPLTVLWRCGALLTARRRPAWGTIRRAAF